MYLPEQNKSTDVYSSKPNADHFFKSCDFPPSDLCFPLQKDVLHLFSKADTPDSVMYRLVNVQWRWGWIFGHASNCTLFIYITILSMGCAFRYAHRSLILNGQHSIHQWVSWCLYPFPLKHLIHRAVLTFFHLIGTKDASVRRHYLCVTRSNYSEIASDIEGCLAWNFPTFCD